MITVAIIFSQWLLWAVPLWKGQVGLQGRSGCQWGAAATCYSQHTRSRCESILFLSDNTHQMEKQQLLPNSKRGAWENGKILLCEKNSAEKITDYGKFPPPSPPLMQIFPCKFVFTSFCLFVFPSFRLSVFPSFCPSVFLSFCLSVFLPFYLSVFLSFCLSAGSCPSSLLGWVRQLQV